MPDDLKKELMQRAYKRVAAEMPDVKPVSVSPRQAGWMDRIFMPRGAIAITNPFTGNVVYNPEMVEDPEQTLVHELTHSRQAQHAGLGSQIQSTLRALLPETAPPKTVAQNPALQEPYYWRPEEMEAFQAERDRATRLKLKNYTDPVLGTGDVALPVSGQRSKH